MPWSNAQRYGAALPQRRAAVAAAAAAEQTQGPAPASPLLPADSLQQGALPACDSSLAKDVEVDVTGTAHHLGEPNACSCTHAAWLSHRLLGFLTA